MFSNVTSVHLPYFIQGQIPPLIAFPESSVTWFQGEFKSTADIIGYIWHVLTKAVLSEAQCGTFGNV